LAYQKSANDHSSSMPDNTHPEGTCCF